MHAPAPDVRQPYVRGPRGAQGLPPAHQWIGTGLQFANPDGSYGALTNLQGPSGAAGAFQFFATVAQFTSASIGAGIGFAIVAGYYAAGDGGFDQWSKLDSAPSPVELWHKQSADGAYWIYTPINFVKLRSLGAKGNLSTNTTPYLQAAIDFAAGRWIYASFGQYRYNGPVISTAILNLFGDGDGSGPGLVSNTNCTQFMSYYSSGNLIDITSYYRCRITGIQFNTDPASRPRTSGAAISITGPVGHVNANSEVTHCGFTSQYDCVSLDRTAYPKVTDNYADTFGRSFVHIFTTVAIEGGGGTIERNYVFGTSGSTTQLACISGETGYINISRNVLIGAKYGVHLAVSNNPAGSPNILDNWIENQGEAGVLVQTQDGSIITMLSVERNKFSNVDFTANYVASVWIVDYAGAYLSGFKIKDNTHRHNVSSNFKFIWDQTGANGTISDELFENLGAGASTTGIDAATGTDADLVVPLSIFDCQFKGVFATRYVTNAKATIRDHQGLLLAAFPTCAPGSRIYGLDAKRTSSTDPTAITGGAGGWCDRNGSAWHTLQPN